MKKSLIILGIFIMSIFMVTGCGRTSEFGTVNMQKVATESTKIQELQEEFQKKAMELQERAIKELAPLSGEEKTEKENMFKSEMMVLQKEYGESLKNTVDQAMSEVAKEKKLGAVLSDQVVLHGGQDVTEDVLNKLK